jgi:hypothetical protein
LGFPSRNRLERFLQRMATEAIQQARFGGKRRRLLCLLWEKGRLILTLNSRIDILLFGGTFDSKPSKEVTRHVPFYPGPKKNGENGEIPSY